MTIQSNIKIQKSIYSLIPNVVGGYY